MYRVLMVSQYKHVLLLRRNPDSSAAAQKNGTWVSG